MDNLKEVIKATLFVAGEGIDTEFLAEKLDVKHKDIKDTIQEMKSEINEQSGIQIIEYKGKVQLTSNPKYVEQISAVLNPIREKALTKAALETLAIIAYKQPITKLEVESIRGHSSDYAVNILEENKLIEVVGRKDAVGKPLLYGTTDEFLKRFGLVNIDELPDYEELLERIAVIRSENAKDERTGEGLYFDYKLEDTDQEKDNIEDIADRIKNESI